MTPDPAPTFAMDDLEEVCRQYRELAGQYLDLMGDVRDARSPDRDQPLLTRAEVDRLRHAVERFRGADCDASFRIVVTGTATSGKSALINALVGAPVLPESDQPCTLVPTVIRRSAEGREGAFLRYLSGAMLSDLLRAYANRSESDGWPTDGQGAAELGDAQVDMLVRSLPQRVDQQDARALLKALRDPDVNVWVNGKEEGGLLAAANPEATKDLMVRSGHRSERYVLDAVIRELTTVPFEGNVEIVDLPGAGGLDTWAQEAVLRHLRSADAVLLIADGEVGDAERRLLDLILQRANQQAERVFVVISRMDRHRGLTAESLRRSWTALEKDWQESFGGTPLRLCYTSARHALAQAKAARAAGGDGGVAVETGNGDLAFPSTHHEQVDRLLGHVKDGGVTHLTESLENFLREDATRLRREQLNATWRELVDQSAVVIKPAAGRAGMLLSERALGAAQRGEEIIVELESAARKELKYLKRSVESVETYLRDGTNDLLTRLKALAFAACTEGLRDLTDEDKRESASDIVRRIVPSIRDTFEELCIHAVLEFAPVQEFCERCRESLRPFVDRLEDIDQAGVDGLIPPLPTEPSELVRSCLELRISESLRTHGRGAPHRPADENTQFNRFEEAFTEDVRKFQNRQARQLIADLSEFLAYYLAWHLRRFAKRLFAVTKTLRSPEFAADHPDVYKALATDGDDREEQARLDGLSRLAERLNELARAAVA